MQQYQPYQASRGFSISRAIRGFWREIENVLTSMAGPLLIVASIVQAWDIYSNHAITAYASWLGVAWGLARAIGVTIWIRPAIHQVMYNRRHGGAWFGWVVLAGFLFLADIQALLLFGSYSSGMQLVGVLGILNPSPYGWLVEVGILGAVLIVVHAIVDFAEHEQQQAAHAQTIAQAVTEPAPHIQVHATGTLSALPPLPTAAFYPYPQYPQGYPQYPQYPQYGGSYAPPTYPPAYTPQSAPQSAPQGQQAAAGVNVYQTPEPTPTPATPGKRTRSNAGRPVQSVAERLERVAAVLRDHPQTTDRELAAMFGVSEATANKDRHRIPTS